MKRILVGGCAALLVMAGCADDPSLYVGGPPGATTRLQLSTGDLSIRVGEAVVVGAAALDAVGNVTGDVPSFSACSGAPVTVGTATGENLYSAAASITGAASAVGAGCVNVTAGGVSDTIHVEVGPAGLVIDVADPIIGYDSEDPAANVFTFGATGYDAGGAAVSGSAPLSWSLSNATVAAVNAATGDVTTTGLGSTVLRVRGPGGVNAAAALTIAAPALAGTASASSGNNGALITATRTAGPTFDANTTAFVSFGANAAFIDSYTANSMTIAVPATGQAAGTRADIVFRGMGANDVDRRIPFTLTQGGSGHAWTPASNSCGTGPSLNTNASPGGYMYYTQLDGGGGTNVGTGYGGTVPDQWFTWTNNTGGPADITINLTWLGTADTDMYIYFNCTGGSVGSSAAGNPPYSESVSLLAVPNGTNVNIRLVQYAGQGTVITNGRVRVVVN